MNSSNAVIPFRLRSLAPAVLAGLLAACTTSTDGLFSGEKVDYGAATTKTKPLEVPPDLSQLARESRYQPKGGTVSAASVAAAAPAGPARAASPVIATPTVALNASGDIRMERQGQLRWLVVAQPPEPLFPQVRAFWEANGFTIDVENAATGILETNWSENRAKLPQDAVRNLIGSLLKDFYDTGERDRFRTRFERTAAGTEIYISHRGAQEIYADAERKVTDWSSRPNDPGLEAEMLSRLMVALGGTPEPVRTAAAGAPAASASAAAAMPAAAAPARARLLTTPGVAALEMDETFDRSWRQVGLALDRTGFTVEDRDRTSGLYYVRYVDPKHAGEEGPGFWARVFGNTSNPQAPVRYRVALKSEASKTTVSVQTSAGEPDVGENGKRIVEMLLKELR